MDVAPSVTSRTADRVAWIIFRAVQIQTLELTQANGLLSHSASPYLCNDLEQEVWIVATRCAHEPTKLVRRRIHIMKNS
jgi:hypothetical protein